MAKKREPRPRIASEHTKDSLASDLESLAGLLKELQGEVQGLKPGDKLQLPSGYNGFSQGRRAIRVFVDNVRRAREGTISQRRR